MAESVLRDKSKQFAKDIVFLCREIKSTRKEIILSNQLLRSATSIGANIHEAQYAQSKNDFISKLETAQKECYETEYWLKIMERVGIITHDAATSLLQQCGSIRCMLIASIRKVKAR